MIEAFEGLYSREYGPVVRLAYLLVGSVTIAEDLAATASSSRSEAADVVDTTLVRSEILSDFRGSHGVGATMAA